MTESQEAAREPLTPALPLRMKAFLVDTNIIHIMLYWDLHRKINISGAKNLSRKTGTLPVSMATPVDQPASH